MFYVFIEVKKVGGLNNACTVYVWKHIVSLYYRTALWMFTKLGRDEVLMAWHMHRDVLAISAQGRIQGEAK